MKTEKEFSDHFFTACIANPNWKEKYLQVLKSLSVSYWTDLTSHLSFYFSLEDRLEITEKAAGLLMSQVNQKDLMLAWAEVLRDFNQNNYWGHQQTSQKPKLKKTEEQKIFWKLFKYVWAFIQSMIVLKIAVYYYGLESADHPDQTSIFWVWFYFAISFCSLLFFAYRNRHDNT